MIDENSVFVSNLAWISSEMNLGKHFESYGDINMVKIFEDKFGRSKGIGIVEIEGKSIFINLSFRVKCIESKYHYS